MDPSGPSRKHHWTGLFDPRITGPSPSIYLFLKNRRSGFTIVPELREGTPVVIPRLYSPDVIQRDFASFGLLIGTEEPHYTSEYLVVESVQKEFTRIKQCILGNIIHVLCDKELLSKHDYIITNGLELTEYGLMRPRYIQLKFHDATNRDAFLTILVPK
jgi:hypothetical protein